MESKEKIYDEQISPLFKQIIDICKKEGIAMFAEFQYAELEFSKTLVYPEETIRRNGVFKMYNALSQCKTEEGVNIDKFVFHIAKNYDNESSILLNMLGNKPKG